MSDAIGAASEHGFFVVGSATIQTKFQRRRAAVQHKDEIVV